MALRWDGRVLGMKKRPKKRKGMMEQKNNGFELGWDKFRR